MKHFAVGSFKPAAVFLPSDVYAKVRDSIVRACVEALLLDEKEGKILLGKRNILPWSNWWTFGGRMIAGESPEKAVQRVVKEDLGLDAALGKFIFLDAMSLLFSRRQEEPQENGCHDLSLFFLLPVKKQEIERISFRKSEYGEIKWFGIKDVTEKEGFHPATVECLKRALALK